jgi:hypothetical protein
VTTEQLSLTIAALAVVVGPVIGYLIAMRGFAHERQRDAARFDHERRINDLGDVRSALASGALALHVAKETMKDNLGDFDSPLATGEDWPADFADRIRSLERRRDALEAAVAALQIRLRADEPAAVALSRAWVTLRKLIVVYQMAYRNRGPRGVAARERRDENAAAWELTMEFDDRRDDYLKAAQELAGAKLGDG